MIYRLKVAFFTLICASLAACSGGSSDSGFLGGGDSENPLTIVTSELPDLAAAPYAEILEATGGRSPYSWAMVDDDGTGLTLDDTGVLRADAGVDPGQYAITVRVTDNANRQTEKSLLIQVTLAPLAIATTALPQAEAGAAYTALLIAEGGTPPLRWELLSDGGTGLAIPNAEEGLLRGVPSVAPGTYGLTIQVSDASGLSAQSSLLLEIAGDTPGPLQIVAPDLPDGSLGVRYAAVLTAEGGTGEYTWNLLSDGQSGLDLTPEGVLNGFPARSGSFGLTFEVNDGFTIAQGSAVLRIDADAVEPLTVETTSLEPAVPGVPYAAVLEASGGSGAYSWSLVSGGGSGLNVTAGGVLAGVPPSPGTFGLVVRVSSGSSRVDQALTLLVGPSPDPDVVSILTSSLPAGTTMQNYATIVRAFGGDGDYTWTVRDDGGSTLAFANMADAAAGLLTSTPISVGDGTYTVLLEVRDGGSGVDLKSFTFTVNP